MKSAAVSKLKATLSEYIAWVKRGEEVLITERGRPVARIVPVGDLPADARRSELVRRGILRPGKGRVSIDVIKDRPIINVTQSDIRRIIEEEREDRT
ncbi:MAG: type II toxin-antitoxin system prevent-host-death family antitoxin [Armatimonadota bacterium]|nr:type II toxin-antitoxin system prevent-host-death family antitoxin [Armatimonadota bacterium]